MAMTPKRRILASILGGERDRTPFSPFLAYYFQTLCPEIQQKGELRYLEEMGADPLLRGYGCGWRCVNDKCIIKTHDEGKKRYSLLETPLGTLQYSHIFSSAGNTWFISEHPVKTVEDLKILRYYFEKTKILPEIDTLNACAKDIGERAFILPIVGTSCKSAFQSLVEHWVGTVNLTYLIYDEPEEVAETVRVISEKDRKTVEFTALSDVEGCISWEDTSTTNYSPELYARYIAPEITEWCGILREHNKFYVQHACGHLKNVLKLMAEQGIAAVESISPLPTGDLTMDDAAAVLTKKTAVIGGIEPTFLLDESIESVEIEGKRLLKLFDGRPFVLANSDSCPPGVEYGKFTALCKAVHR